MKKWITMGLILLIGIMFNPIHGSAQEVKVEMSKAEKKAIKQDNKLQDAKIKLGKTLEKLQKKKKNLLKLELNSKKTMLRGNFRQMMWRKSLKNRKAKKEHRKVRK